MAETLTEDGQSSMKSSDAAALRAAALSRAAAGGQLTRSADTAPCGPARSLAFPALEMRAQMVERDGRQFYRVEGYASVVERGYEMWDIFGPYEEIVDRSAFDKTLAANPDVAFLVNHRGLLMARTANDSLDLSMDSTGLRSVAYLNPNRQDVRDLVSAISDQLVTEMSFAFMLKDGSFSSDFSEFRILEADINRGDVSAVNYGANPYTSIAARSREIIADLDHLTPGAARAALGRLQQRLSAADNDHTELDQARAESGRLVADLDRQVAEGTGRRVDFVAALLEI